MKNHPTYDSIESLAQDLSFIRWVKDGDSKSNEFWKNWAIENPSKSDWVEEARNIVESIHFETKVYDQKTIDNLWNRIADSTTKEANPPKKITQLRWFNIAASVALLIMASWWWFNAQAPVAKFATVQKERLNVDLPDLSVATLNADSKLEFDETNWESGRKLTLEGEAFFEVEKGSKFTVNTKFGKVEVLGTSFNVYARDDAFEIKCFTGKVAVTDKSGSKEILTPGEMITISKNIRKADQFVPDKKQLWVKGYYLYQEDRLDKIFNEVERQFGVSIDASEKIRNTIYTGFFEKDNLEKALESICWPVRLQFDIQNKKVTIKEE